MANLVTVGRIALLFVAVAFISTGDAGATGVAVLVTALVIFGDAVDGWVARAWSRPTVFGSIFDIAGDRIVENVYWIVFSQYGMVPLWVPLTMIVRSFLVDAVRSLGLLEGKTAFGESTMMHSRLGMWLSSSRLSRAAYGTAKAAVFCTLLLQLALERGAGSGAFAQGGALAALAVLNQVLVYFVVGFGLLRGVVVLYDTREKILAP